MFIILISICIFQSFARANKYKQNFQNGGRLNTQSDNILTRKQKLKNRCGLPDTSDYETNHCFADGTHHTCCML